MKKLKNISRGRGFTLVEISVGLVVLLVLVTLSASIILLSGNIFMRNAIMNDNSIIAENVCGYIADKLTCAKSIEVSSGEAISGVISSDYYEQLALTDGGAAFLLSRRSAGKSEIYTSAELNGRVISAALDYDVGGWITVTVKLMNDSLDGEQLCVATRTVPLLNKDADFFSLSMLATANTAYQSLYITYSYLD